MPATYRMKGCRWAYTILVSVAVAGSPACAQSFDFDMFKPLSLKQTGVRVIGASVTAAYYSGSYNLGLPGQISDNTNSNVQLMSGSAIVGWSRQRPKSNISVLYSPTYLRAANLSGYESMNHSLDVTVTRSLRPKWTLSGALRGILMDFSQSMLAPTAYSSASTKFLNIDELAANMSHKTGFDTVGVMDSPETAYLYGGRQFSSAATVSLAYDQSSRSMYRVSANLVRTQVMATDNAQSQSLAYAIPRTTVAGVDGGWVYSLTPRTTASLDISLNRNMSVYQDALVTQTNISLGRTMTEHWFVQGMIGVGVLSPLREAAPTGAFSQKQYGASGGYKGRAHTFMGSYARTISDLFGVAAAATETSAGSWAWRRPGSSYSLSSTFGYSHLIGPNLPNSGSWSTFTAFAKSLDSHVVISIAYRYVQYPQYLFQTSSNLTQSGVVLVMSWSPSTRL